MAEPLGFPVVVVASGGLPVTNAPNAAAPSIVQAACATVVTDGGVGITLTTSPQATPLFLTKTDGTPYP